MNSQYQQRSIEVQTELGISISELFDLYIPDVVKEIPKYETIKLQYIKKWQLFLQPLVQHCIKIEDTYDETKYEALENQLIAQLAARDLLVTELAKSVATMAVLASQLWQIEQSSEEVPGESSEENNSIKKITTGPTEVEYFNSAETAGKLYNGIKDALKDGGLIDELKSSICMLATRLLIYLPNICEVFGSNTTPPRNYKRITHPVNRMGLK